MRSLALVERDRRYGAYLRRVSDVEREDAMRGGVRLNPIVADHDRRRAPALLLIMNELQPRIGSVESSNVIKPTRSSVHEHRATVLQHARLIRSVVGRKLDRFQ